MNVYQQVCVELGQYKYFIDWNINLVETTDDKANPNYYDRICAAKNEARDIFGQIFGEVL